MKTKPAKTKPAQSAPVAATAPATIIVDAAAVERFADIFSRKLDAIAAAIAGGNARADEYYKRSDERFAAAEKDRKRSDERFAAAENDRKRSDERFAAIDKQAVIDRRIFKNLTETSAKRDRGLEETFAAGLPDALKPFGVKLTHRQISTRVRNTNHSPEFDIVAVNGEAVVLAEIKLHLTWRDVRHFFRSLKAFREEFPKHRGKTLHGAVAGLIVDDEAADLALKNGFFILQMDGGQIYPDTPKNFRPRAY